MEKVIIWFTDNSLLNRYPNIWIIILLISILVGLLIFKKPLKKVFNWGYRIISNMASNDFSGNFSKFATLITGLLPTIWYILLALAFIVCLGYPYFNNHHPPSPEDVYFSVAMWDYAAISLSLALTLLYYFEIFFSPKEDSLDWLTAGELGLAVPFTILSLVTLIGAWLALNSAIITHQYFYVILYLLITTIIFIGLDFFIWYCLQKRINDHLKVEHTGSAEEIKKAKEAIAKNIQSNLAYIDKIKFSLKYANCITFVGLIVLLIYVPLNADSLELLSNLVYTS